MSTDDVADRLRRIKAVADDIASRPDLGPYEVGVLRELLEEADSISGAKEARQATVRRYHDSPGRAVDILPRDPAAWLQARPAVDGDPADVPWWAPDPGAVNDVNPICGCHICARCPDCRCCKNCEGCYCHED